MKSEQMRSGWEVAGLILRGGERIEAETQIPFLVLDEVRWAEWWLEFFQSLRTRARAEERASEAVFADEAGRHFENYLAVAGFAPNTTATDHSPGHNANPVPSMPAYSGRGGVGRALQDSRVSESAQRLLGEMRDKGYAPAEIAMRLRNYLAALAQLEFNAQGDQPQDAHCIVLVPQFGIRQLLGIPRVSECTFDTYLERIISLALVPGEDSTPVFLYDADQAQPILFCLDEQSFLADMHGEYVEVRVVTAQELALRLAIAYEYEDAEARNDAFTARWSGVRAERISTGVRRASEAEQLCLAGGGRDTALASSSREAVVYREARGQHADTAPVRGGGQEGIDAVVRRLLG